jgi:hypothetical protein
MTHEYAVRLGFVIFCLLGFFIFAANFVAQKHLVRDRLLALDEKARRFVSSWPTPEFVEPAAVYWIYLRRCAIAFVICDVALEAVWRT